MKLKLRSTAATALSNLGHVYTAIGDYPNALASHKQCVLLVKQSSDKLWEAREIGKLYGAPAGALVCFCLAKVQTLVLETKSEICVQFLSYLL